MRFAVPKKSGGKRFLSVPTVRDRVLQSAVYLLTRGRFEQEFEDCSYAYRQGRSVRDAVRKVRDLREAGYRYVLDADIQSCFDSIPHEQLFERLGEMGFPPYVDTLFRGWVQAEIYDGDTIWSLKCGVPQGSVVSPMLSNLFLDRLDEGLALRGLALVRYADDFVVLGKNPAAAERALEVTEEILSELDLALHPEKTTVREFSDGFSFLGAVFLGDSVLLPWDSGRPERGRPTLPAPLGLRRYLQLKRAAGTPLPAAAQQEPEESPGALLRFLEQRGS